MRKWYSCVRVWSKFLAIILLFLLFITLDGAGGPTGRGGVRKDKDHATLKKDNWNDDGLMEIYATGSSLPDCSHACGPCFPCKRVMVSFKCSVAESCPVVYRCMCRGKYYHVPSN